MAMSGDLTASLGDLEQEITCGVCQEQYSDPRLLPCGHYYCQQCLSRLAMRMTRGEPFPCPECRQEVDLKGAPVEELRPAFFVNRLKETFSKLKKAHDSLGACQVCADMTRNSVAFCQHCHLVLCSECMVSHQRENEGHVLILLEGEKDPGPTKMEAKSKFKKCDLHKKKLKLFCFTCDLLICRDCTLKDHKDHSFEFNNIVASTNRHNLAEKLEVLKTLKQNLSDDLAVIKAADDDLLAQRDSLADIVTESFNELHKILDKRKSQLLEEASIRVNEKRRELEIKENEFFETGKKIQDLINSVEVCIRDHPDDSVVSTFAALENEIEKEREECLKQKTKLYPLEEMDLGVEVECADALQQLCQDKAKTTQLQSVVNISGMAARVEIDKIHEFTVTRKLSNENPVKAPVQIQCDLERLRDGSVHACSTDQCGPGEYCIRYTPTTRGRHKLHILVNGKEVAGSPFSTFVFVSPNQLGKPTKVWTGIRKPFGISVNSANEVIYAEHNGDIVVKDKHGVTARTIRHSDHHFQQVRGISVDEEDSIYFTDATSNRIFKASRDCGTVEVHEMNQVQGPGHLDICVCGSQVLVCEVGNRGAIQVYNQELKHLHQIMAAESDTAYLNVFSDGNHIYASHYFKPCVHVLNAEGDILLSLRCDEWGKDVLETPRGACVWDQHVYVADADKKAVKVFDFSGNYVTSIGNSTYHSVCVDSDGFVYASSFRGNKIDIF